MRRPVNVKAQALANGWRSGLEETLGARLQALGVPFDFEAFSIPFLQPQKPRKYTPDFTLLSNGIVIETKGRFLTADRQKHILVKEQYPDLDLRFVFSNPNTRISKQSKTTYGRWCESKGFLYAAKTIPDRWLEEPPNRASLALIRKLRGT
jgi:hypothetical protein